MQKTMNGMKEISKVLQFAAKNKRKPGGSLQTAIFSNFFTP